MICEFALDPELVATWHDRNEYLFFQEKFGLTTRRIISAYPKKKWKSKVWRAFTASQYGQDDNAIMRLDALLSDLSHTMVKRRSSFTELSTWLEQAEAEHIERPFHAILAKNNPRENEHVISVRKLIEEGHPFWKVPDMPPVPRNASALVAAVAPILLTGLRIDFIDPYFDPEKLRFRETMSAFLHEIWENGYMDNPQVGLHISIDRIFKDYEFGQNRDLSKENKAFSALKYSMQKFLPELIPDGQKVKVTIWKRRHKGQKLHNRYILSDFCGVLFGAGTDQNDDPETTDTDDLVMLSYDSFIKWSNAYLGTPAAFDCVDKPFEINGKIARF